MPIFLAINKTHFMMYRYFDPTNISDGFVTSNSHTFHKHHFLTTIIIYRMTSLFYFIFVFNLHVCIVNNVYFIKMLSKQMGCFPNSQVKLRKIVIAGHVN